MATVGSSAGITSQLTTWGRIIIMGMMFLGGGPFTVFLSLYSNVTRKNSLCRY